MQAERSEGKARAQATRRRWRAAANGKRRVEEQKNRNRAELQLLRLGVPVDTTLILKGRKNPEYKPPKLGLCIMTDRKAVIKNADMSEDMQQDAVDCATQAMEKYNIEKDIAAYIKKEFDKKYNPTWHCIVGRNFGSYVTHETKHFIYFYLGQVAILLFKSG
ncbi:dynein, light chain, LC8-type 2a [Silurus meridionalis]|nr:dynein, light chain, LC8-type 2a [Silurus meridionalis]